MPAFAIVNYDALSFPKSRQALFLNFCFDGFSYFLIDSIGCFLLLPAVFKTRPLVVFGSDLF
jgi:hypothetical protein